MSRFDQGHDAGHIASPGRFDGVGIAHIERHRGLALQLGRAQTNLQLPARVPTTVVPMLIAMGMTNPPV